jgi:hypothetical protein
MGEGEKRGTPFEKEGRKNAALSLRGGRTARSD